jgi:hypothetical protein
MRMSPLRLSRRHRRIITRGAAAAACALLAAACGSTAAPGTGSGTATSTTGPGTAGTSSAGTTSSAKVSLDVSFLASPTTAARHYTLTCEPAGGTAPDPATACTRLLKGTSVFAPQPAHIMCPMIIANAGRIIVSGTYLGQKVHETIVDGGCQLSRYAKLKQVFN